SILGVVTALPRGLRCNFGCEAADLQHNADRIRMTRPVSAIFVSHASGRFQFEHSTVRPRLPITRCSAHVFGKGPSLIAVSCRPTSLVMQGVSTQDLQLR